MSMIGKSLAHYSITAQIGKGVMGEVYQAKCNLLKMGKEESFSQAETLGIRLPDT
jgi:hypothetical protein